MSDETTQSGAPFCMKASLSYPIFADTASSVTAKVPPKPQHSSTRSNSTNLSPGTPLSRAFGFENATLCSNVAHGNSEFADLQNIVEKFNQVVGISDQILFFRRVCRCGEFRSHHCPT
jgi:hypothetical protein